MDTDINFSDHFPLIMSCLCDLIDSRNSEQHSKPAKTQMFPRWDKADLDGFYRYTGDNYTLLLRDLDIMIENDTHDSIDQLYDCIVSVLTEGENQFVPRRDKQFYKFQWNEELTLLKGIACEQITFGKQLGNHVLEQFLQSTAQLVRLP